VAAALAIVVCAAAPAGASAPADEWLQWGHDAGHTHANLGETQLTPAALKTVPYRLQKSEVDVGLLDVGEPLIEGDSMFVTSVGWDYESGRLQRFDIPTETRTWRHDLSCFGRPVVSSSVILIEDKCTETAPAPAQMLSTADGSLVGIAADQLGIVHRGVAYLTNYGGGVYLEPYSITAMDVATRDVLWNVATASHDESLSPLLAIGDTLYVRHQTATEAWDTATGTVRWSTTPSKRTFTPRAATPDALYLRWQQGDLHGIARWDAADGSHEWHIRTPDTSTPFSFSRRAFYETGPDFLAARSATDGSLLWKRSGYPWNGLGQPVFAAGVVWANDGFLEAFNASNGRRLLSDARIPPGTFSVAQGRVFVPTPDGRVFIFQLPA
jgi:hypothetical protein